MRRHFFPYGIQTLLHFRIIKISRLATDLLYAVFLDQMPHQHAHRFIIIGIYTILRITFFTHDHTWTSRPLLQHLV